MIELEAAQSWQTVGGSPAFLYSYNKQVPGPVIEARPGDTLRLHFKNSLPEETHLHFHGLHVPPAGNADNAFLMIPPGESSDYEIPIPNNHPAGTFWIHPHVSRPPARCPEVWLFRLSFEVISIACPESGKHPNPYSYFRISTSTPPDTPWSPKVLFSCKSGKVV